MKGGIDLDAEAQQQPRLRELPFDAQRKRMSTVHQRASTPHATPIAYVKGAPKEVLALCTRLLLHGQVCPLEETHRTQAMAATDAAARRGLRVLAVAQRALPADLTTYTPETIEADLTFLGLLAMHDPPRPEVTDAVEHMSPRRDPHHYDHRRLRVNGREYCAAYWHHPWPPAASADGA